MNRTVVAKGLSEREVTADTAIWPILYTEADNQLADLVEKIQDKNQRIMAFLQSNGFDHEEISIAPPSIEDQQARSYVDLKKLKFRYIGSSTVTVFSRNVKGVRSAMQKLTELGKQDIAISSSNYSARTEFLFTGLNDLKPVMIEEATRNAREVAEKFALDSSSKLGKIQLARQGVFEITHRDQNTPHIKKVRVVSTITYYLVD